MTMFEISFDPTTIYNSIFFSVKSVLKYPTLERLRDENPSLYADWTGMSDLIYFDKDVYYENNAIHYPEFSKIVAITYANVDCIDGLPKGNLKKSYNDDEFLVIASIINFFQKMEENVKSYPFLCGYNIIAQDIPFLIKKFFQYRDKFENKSFPAILKNCLNSKNWEASIIDLVGLWKFNGNYNHNVSLNLISNFLNVEKNKEILSSSKLSKVYWENINTKHDQTLKSVLIQSVEQVNILIEIMDKFRKVSNNSL